ncbi:hypothetical protein IWW45_008017 [Coemansia sp. RSA 485]|nr:hypothetical protein IWW45_008017 [Coemansia sp. RSA 485]
MTGSGILTCGICVEIVSPITLPINIYGRVAYLYHVNYSGKRAVLKIAWSLVNSTPEGAVYDLLHRHNIKHVPKVYNRGILVENLNGYCLDVIDDIESLFYVILKAYSTKTDTGCF